MPQKKTTVLAASSPVTALPGISETRGALFSKLGIETLADLVTHYPRAYEFRGKTASVVEAAESAGRGETVSLILTVGTQPKVTTIRRGMVLTRFTAFDETGSVQITYFNQPYLRDAFAVGTTHRFFGRCERGVGGRLAMNTPGHEPLPPGDPGDGSTLPAICPIYRTTSGLTRKLLTDAVSRALDALYPPDAEHPDPLPHALLREEGLCGRTYAVERIHRPENEAALDAARKRLIFEELLLFALSLRIRRAQSEARTARPMHAPDMQRFYDRLPYTLTGAQMRAIDAFLHDMTARPSPMNRLLSGDVGSGKTVCAAAALYVALENGCQAAMMAPTEILARQHYDDLSPLFAVLGYECALLVGATKPKEKSQIKARLADGTLPLVIGTHALLEENVVFADCGLVITDEQHRFGVSQRAALAKKAENVHTLIMSATPIPRTLALMLFGDLDMSVLDELPPGRQRVQTFAVDESYRDRLNGFIRKQAEAGHQVYIVCPAIDEGEEEPIPGEAVQTRPTMKAAVAYARELSERVFPDLPVGFLHGKMRPAEKEAIMRRFAAGELLILVSTTVIEVGVNVPTATLMVVENAEYFGLSQLHQLRGRVGRGRDKSWCILVSDKKGEDAGQRLDILCKTANGYEVAERDLEMRGPGDFFAADPAGVSWEVRQSGGLRFDIASFCDDVEFLRRAFSAADAIIAADPMLEREEHAALREALMGRFGALIL